MVSPAHSELTGMLNPRTARQMFLFFHPVASRENYVHGEYQNAIYIRC